MISMFGFLLLEKPKYIWKNIFPIIFINWNATTVEICLTFSSGASVIHTTAQTIATRRRRDASAASGRGDTRRELADMIHHKRWWQGALLRRYRDHDDDAPTVAVFPDRRDFSWLGLLASDNGNLQMFKTKLLSIIQQFEWWMLWNLTFGNSIFFLLADQYISPLVYIYSYLHICAHIRFFFQKNCIFQNDYFMKIKNILWQKCFHTAPQLQE